MSYIELAAYIDTFISGPTNAGAGAFRSRHWPEVNSYAWTDLMQRA